MLPEIDGVVTYEAAILAKKNGFNEPTEMYYHIYDDIDRAQSSLESTGGTRAFFNSYNIYRCAAPSQSELQKWLREKRGISVEVNYSSFFGGFIPSFIKMTNKPVGVLAFMEAEATVIAVKERITYEQALEIGLIGALEVIKPKSSNM